VVFLCEPCEEAELEDRDDFFESLLGIKDSRKQSKERERRKAKAKALAHTLLVPLTGECSEKEREKYARRLKQQSKLRQKMGLSPFPIALSPIKEVALEEEVLADAANACGDAAGDARRERPEVADVQNTDKEGKNSFVPIESDSDDEGALLQEDPDSEEGEEDALSSSSGKRKRGTVEDPSEDSSEEHVQDTMHTDRVVVVTVPGKGPYGMQVSLSPSLVLGGDIFFCTVGSLCNAECYIR